jgi:ferredoxin-NADP reductase
MTTHPAVRHPRSNHPDEVETLVLLLAVVLAVTELALSGAVRHGGDRAGRRRHDRAARSAASAGCTVTYQVASQWTGGFQGDVTVKNLGDGSARVASLRPGTKALVEGPYGKLTGETYPGGPVVLLACGIGVTPLLSLLGELPYGPGEATLIYRARNEAEVAFRAELDWFAAHRGVRIVYLLGPRAARPSWLPAQFADHGDADVLRQIAPQITDSHVYVCGPDAWSEAARTATAAAGVKPERSHTELFSW